MQEGGRQGEACRMGTARGEVGEGRGQAGGGMQAGDRQGEGCRVGIERIRQRGRGHAGKG